MPGSLIWLQRSAGNRAAATAVVQRQLFGCTPEAPPQLPAEQAKQAVGELSGRLGGRSIASVRLALRAPAGDTADSDLVQRLVTFQDRHGLAPNGRLDDPTGNAIVRELARTTRFQEAVEFVIDLYDMPFVAGHYQITTGVVPPSLPYTIMATTDCYDPGAAAGASQSGAQSRGLPPGSGVIFIRQSIIPTDLDPGQYADFVHTVRHELYHAEVCPPDGPMDGETRKRTLPGEEFEAYFRELFPQERLPKLTGRYLVEAGSMAITKYKLIPADLLTPRQRAMYYQVLAVMIRAKYQAHEEAGLLSFAEKSQTAHAAIAFYDELPTELRTAELTALVDTLR